MTTKALLFTLTKADPGWSVKLSCEGHATAEGTFTTDFSRNSRLGIVAAKIGADRFEQEDLPDIGSQLWSALLSGEVGERYEEICGSANQDHFYQLRLGIPSELQHLPWETLYDEKGRAFLISQENFCVLRDPPANINPPRLVPKPAAKLSVLVVVPEGHGLQAAHEFNNIKQAVGRLGDSIRLERLDGRVTTVRLAEKLREGWDVVHFVGHGDQEVTETGQQRVRIRLNSDRNSDEGEFWASAEQFAAIFHNHPVRLAFLNCCLGAAASPTRSLAGLGPFLLRAGVATVVAMRYEIQDDDALVFAQEFYRHLLETGDYTGRVDRALQLARLRLYLTARDDNVRSFITPVLFAARGRERLHHIIAANADGVQPPEVVIPTTHLAIPADLMEAVRERRCIPIIGPSLARGAAARGQAPVGPCELARMLAQRFDFNGLEANGLDDEDDTAGEQLLQRVCQYVQARKPARVFELIQAIKKTYSTAPVPQVYSAFAQWDTPGFVYTYFDGLLAEALRTRNVRVVNKINQQMTCDNGVQPLLVHLRGTITDANTLVLTEYDHEVLWENMAAISAQVIDLISGELGRTLLFVGISPDDPLVRRFVRQLMPNGPTRNQGPVYFASSRYREDDHPYWQLHYRTSWIPYPPNTVIQEITQRL